MKFLHLSVLGVGLAIGSFASTALASSVAGIGFDNSRIATVRTSFDLLSPLIRDHRVQTAIEGAEQLEARRRRYCKSGRRGHRSNCTHKRR